MTLLPYQLGFSHRHIYGGLQSISVPVTLISDRYISTDVLASVDTGSTFCVFHREYAELLQLDLTSGTKEKMSTATGYFYCYGHEVTVSVFEMEWQAIVYFAEPEAFPANVVGRVGFLDRLQLGITDYEQAVYLGLHDPA